MAIILPHGVLFRGAAEGRIRKALIDKHQIETVIGFPDKLFLNIYSSLCLDFKKNRTASDILFVDASREFEKLKKQNHLRLEDVDKIVDTVVQRKEIEKYSHLATLDEIKENDYNLNIPRYVDTYEEEPPVDLVALNNDIKNTNEEIKSRS